MVSDVLHIIAFEPLGTTGLERLADALQEALGLKPALPGSLPVPGASLDRRRAQYRSRGLLAALASWRSSRGEAGLVLGVTDRDIFIPGLSFIFGEADRENGVAVVSTARLAAEGEEEGQLEEERLLKEAVHELGHLQGLDHCRDSACIMFYSNSIGHTDAKGPGFCSSCEGERRPDRVGP